jgi:hypothetical protein
MNPHKPTRRPSAAAIGSMLEGATVKIVMQCCATKNPSAASFNVNGRCVRFVAQPARHPRPESGMFVRPDDPMQGTSLSWRQHLTAYNQRTDNPDGLLPAGELYEPPQCPSLYRQLLDHVGAANFYILSAGWGLIRASFLTPDYDITFANLDKEDRWKRRTVNDIYQDYRQLAQQDISPDEPVYFIGAAAYLSLYRGLTQAIIARKVVYYASAKTDTSDADYQYIHYNTGGWNTNWQYRCAQDFLADRIPR